MAHFSVPFKAMGTFCQIRLVAESQLQAEQIAQPAISRISILENRYSRYIPSSLISRINANAGHHRVDLDEESRALFTYAASAFEQSSGLFDVTSGILRRAWNFRKVGPEATLLVDNALPSPEALEGLLCCSGWAGVEWSGGATIQLPAGFEIDFGGFVKEYAADSALAILREGGVSAAMVDMGGDIAAFGANWPIAIKNPREPKTKVAQLNLHKGGLATSGNYERFFMLDNKRYSHILNPFTGWPIVTPASVSVVADSCLVAGTVSTVAMLAGEEGCLETLASFELPFCCVFNDGRVVECF